MVLDLKYSHKSKKALTNPPELNADREIRNPMSILYQKNTNKYREIRCL